MTKNKFQILIIIGLLLSNIIIGFMAFGGKKGKRPAHARPKDVIIAKLHFDKEQIHSFETIIDEHQAKVISLDDSLRRTKKSLYQLLKNDELQHQAIDSLTTKIASFQKQIETIHYHHFEDIKTLCRPDQIPAYLALTDELMQIFDNKPPPPPHNR